MVAFNGDINLKAETIEPITKLEEAFGIGCLELLFSAVYNISYLNKLFSHLDSKTAKRKDWIKSCRKPSLLSLLLCTLLF